ncbi:hypothetical protein TWF506_001084 [Arthrobotrys conoides]|uniref:Uncharacterized protein n=1 Tax=Arthrobotrys conoides TaxID=74498 RepID=A0AAN8P1F8_9PEZI
MYEPAKYAPEASEHPIPETPGSPKKPQRQHIFAPVLLVAVVLQTFLGISYAFGLWPLGSIVGYQKPEHERTPHLSNQNAPAVDRAELFARDLDEVDIVGRYAYQSLRHSKNGRPPKPNQVVPIIELVENGKTITVRVSHTHPNHVPRRLPRDVDHEPEESTATSAPHTSHSPGPVIHNAADLEDILFDVGRTKGHRGGPGSDIIHTEYTTRTVAYSTDSTGMPYYHVSTIELYHTHINGNTPIAPEINPGSSEGDRAKALEYKPTSPAGLEAAFLTPEGLDSIASPTAYPAQINSALQSEETSVTSTTSRISKLAPIADVPHDANHVHQPGNIAYNASHGDSSYTHNHTHLSVGHDDGDGDTPHFNNTTSIVTMVRHSAPHATESIICDAFFNINRTVTHVSGRTWRQVTTTRPPVPPVPTNRVIGPIETIFDPPTNVTYEIIPMEVDDPEVPFSIYWNPVATGTPTRADHISLASSWRANGGNYPAMPTRYDIVWDHRTNTTWNKTVEGTWDEWIDVYVSITTQYPAPPKTPVAAVPTSPGQPEYDPVTNPDFTWGPGPNWVGPSSESLSVEAHASTSASQKSTEVQVLPDGRTMTVPAPTGGLTSLPKPTENLKQEIDQHYPVSFFPKGPENYVVWSEWIGYCSVIKHINSKGEDLVPLRPFGDVDSWGSEYVEYLCAKGVDYYIHINNESVPGQYWSNALKESRNISDVGYANYVPSWKAYPRTVPQNSEDLLQAEWIADCVVLLHHAGTSTWGNEFLQNARKNFDPHGRRYISDDDSTVRAPTKCRKIDMLLHIEEYHNIDGFLIGDWWITPTDIPPVHGEYSVITTLSV